MSNYLFVVAHPDDEVLGAGATISKLLKECNNVYVCILNSLDETRYKDNSERILEDIEKSHSILGITKSYIGTFEDGNFGNEKHRKIVEFIENAIKDCEPDYIFTHYNNDMNYDHEVTYQCCREAARYSHRGIYKSNELKGLYMMEVPSETNWGFDCCFTPNLYINVDIEDIDKKIDALKVYENVIRREPHPRSEINIKSNAISRGGECNSLYAEGFKILYEKR